MSHPFKKQSQATFKLILRKRKLIIGSLVLPNLNWQSHYRAGSHQPRPHWARSLAGNAPPWMGEEQLKVLSGSSGQVSSPRENIPSLSLLRR